MTETMPAEARATLAATRFFADVLSPTEIDSLASRSTMVRFGPGEALVREDERGDSMYVIVSGEAEVTLGSASARRHLARLSAGDIVGEGSLMTGSSRSATVTAITPIVAIEIGQPAIGPLFDAEPKLVERFAAIMERRQAEVDRIYGAGHWNLFGLTREDLATTMRTLFGGGI